MSAPSQVKVYHRPERKMVAVPKELRDGGVAIVKARWNAEVVDALEEGCIKALREGGLKDSQIHRHEVPGSYELPFAAKSIIMKGEGKISAVIALGTLVKGETMHFEYICQAVSEGLARVGLDTGVPVIFGVLTVLTEEQAKARAGLLKDGHNHGEDWGQAALEMSQYRFPRSAL